MSHSTVIAGTAIAAFLFYITAKGHLPAYLSVLWGAAVPATATLQNTAAGAVAQGLNIGSGVITPGLVAPGGLITGGLG